MSIVDRLARYFARAKAESQPLNYGREIVGAWVVAHCAGRPRIRLLDVGAGKGDDLIGAAATLGVERVEMLAVETYPPYRKRLAARGIRSFAVDIERERLPIDDASVDVIVINQVLEHTKEIFWILSELRRVLRADGALIIGVPNLGSLHNRLALLAGRQPPAIRALGPHVRGFTMAAMRELLETHDYFRIEAATGANFYPLNALSARRAASAFPGLAVSTFYRVCRTTLPDPFHAILDSLKLETPYFRGPP